MELIVFIIIVGVAMAGIFSAFNTMTAASADPQVRKQILAIAESLLAEVQLMPFTYCDPEDINATTATEATQGAGVSEPGKCALPPEVAAALTTDPSTAEATEGRYPSAALPFDNVNDYHRFSMTSGIRDLNDNPIGGLDAYSASITVTQAGLGPASDAIAGDTIPAAAALKISVTVTGPGNVSITLDGYRTRYAPNTLP
jgi:MSHA pilin protein MshD